MKDVKLLLEVFFIYIYSLVTACLWYVDGETNQCNNRIQTYSRDMYGVAVRSSIAKQLDSCIP